MLSQPYHKREPAHTDYPGGLIYYHNYTAFDGVVTLLGKTKPPPDESMQGRGFPDPVGLVLE